MIDAENDPGYSDLPEYQIAFMLADGGWDIVETFHAENADGANEYARQTYLDQEWYVLRAGRNINAGQ